MDDQPRQDDAQPQKGEQAGAAKLAGDSAKPPHGEQPSPAKPAGDGARPRRQEQPGPADPAGDGAAAHPRPDGEGGAGQLSSLSIQAQALVRSIESLSSIFWVSFGGTFLSVFFAGLSRLEANAAADHISLGEYQVPKAIVPLVSVAFAGFLFWLTANRLAMLHFVLKTSRLPRAMVHEIFRLNPPVLHVFDADGIRPWSLTSGVSVLLINWAVFFGNSLAFTWSSALQRGAATATFDPWLLVAYLLCTALVLIYGIRATLPALARILDILHGIHFKVGWPRRLVALALVCLVFLINHWGQVSAPEQDDNLLGPAMGNAIDGETLFLRGVEVKLFGMDAMEPEQTCQDADGLDYPCGRRATQALQTLLRSGPVVCFPMYAMNAQRVLAVCELAKDSPTTPDSPIDFMADRRPNNLSRLMIAQGHALAVGVGANFFSTDQEQAQRQRLGIWQGPFQPPSAWRQR